jgi:RNA 3'-terminal phosphate cyclase-like protein
VSGSSAARAAYGAKGLLQRLLPDVWIHTDAHSQKRHGCGPSPSLGLVLAAESTTGAVHAAECCLDYGSGGSDNHDGDGAHDPRRRRELPEDLGRRGAAMLLEEVRRGGCVDTGMQPLALVWMCLTPEDVSRIRVGTLSEHAVATLRLLKLALGVEFKVRADPETRTVVLSCLGIGYRNMARAST